MGVGWPAIQRTTFPQVVLSQKSQVSCWAFFMSTTHFSCQPTWHGWHDWFARGDIRKSIVAPRPSFEAIQVTYAPLRAIVLKNHTKKVRGSIIVYRLIQDLPFKRLDLYNSAVPHFFYSKKNSPFTQKPIVTLTPCFETRLPQLPHFHNLSWKRLKRRTASWYSRSKTFIGCEGIPVRRLRAPGLDLKRPCYTTHHRKLRPVICCEFLAGKKKQKVLVRVCWPYPSRHDNSRTRRYFQLSNDDRNYAHDLKHVFFWWLNNHTDHQPGNDCSWCLNLFEPGHLNKNVLPRKGFKHS